MPKTMETGYLDWYSRPWQPIQTSSSLWAGVETHLTPTEFQLFALLLQHAGRVLTYDMLLSRV